MAFITWNLPTYNILPLSTATCERSFSKLNIIKNDLRNLLKEPHLRCLMRIPLNGPSIDKFNAEEAIKLWKNKENKIFA